MLLLAAGCTQRGDLGRHENSFGFTLNTAHARTSQAGHGADSPNYTDSERDLRIIGERLEAPPHVEPAWSHDRLSLAFRELGHVGDSTNDDFSYYRRLRSPSHNSDAVVWNRIVDDVRHDEMTVTRFHDVAEKVVLEDIAREKGLTRQGSESEAIAAARTRRPENAAYIAVVATASAHRLNIYRRAIDRTAHEAPDPRGHAAENAYKALSDAVEMLLSLSDRAGALVRGETPRRGGRGGAAVGGGPPPIVDMSLSAGAGGSR